MTHKIMIIEENQHTAAYLAETLEKSKYDVISIVSSGEKALPMIEQLPLDLILLDVMLKEPYDGVTTAAEILHRKYLPIIFMAPYSDEVPIIRTKYFLPYGFLTKPVDKNELIAIIRRALIWQAWGKSFYDYENLFHTIYNEVSDSLLWEDPMSSMKNKTTDCTGWHQELMVN